MNRDDRELRINGGGKIVILRQRNASGSLECEFYIAQHFSYGKNTCSDSDFNVYIYPEAREQ